MDWVLLAEPLEEGSQQTGTPRMRHLRISMRCKINYELQHLDMVHTYGIGIGAVHE